MNQINQINKTNQIRRIKMKTRIMALGILCGMAGTLAGCGGGYYRVNDPGGTKAYYTTDIDETKTGAITFKDQKSGSVVTLQSSEVKEISEDEFKAAVKSEEKKTK
jgi:expansin (peptidoglycan-binding protein)